MGIEVDQKLLPMKAHYYLFNAGEFPHFPFSCHDIRYRKFKVLQISIKKMHFVFSDDRYGACRALYTRLREAAWLQCNDSWIHLCNGHGGTCRLDKYSFVYLKFQLILPITGMIAKPLFGAIADKFHKQKFFFILFQFVVIVSFLCVLLIPSIPSQVEFHCHEGVSLFKHCPQDMAEIKKCSIDSLFDNSNETFSCTLTCQKNQQFSKICDKWNVPGLCESSDKNIKMTTIIGHKKVDEFKECFNFILHNATINDHQTTLFCPRNKTDADAPLMKMNCSVKCDDNNVNELLSDESTDQAYSTYQFWIFFLMLIGSWVGMAVVVSIGDAICFEILGDKPQRYGHQRLWGSVGWGSLSIISGILIDKFSTGTTKNYAVGFYIMAILILIDMFVSSKLKYSQSKHSTDIIGDVIEIVKSLRIFVFILWCITVGLGTAMIWNFLFWHLEELGKHEGCEYDSTMKTLQGLMMGIQCFGGELPFFFLSGKILKKIGHVNAMSLVLFTFGCRFFFYSILENPWYALPIELMSGVTFGIFYATMASYASIIAPAGTEATMQVSEN